jgi:hypothetical protein
MNINQYGLCQKPEPTYIFLFFGQKLRSIGVSTRFEL